ncbi:hypothetical protein WAX88_20690 (plasmid) [Photobacterium damselae subsp. damselae]|uniref:hypothetical protein n=1 Tax=Photobacterium damselae TaxID=38293 RepID=UPI00311AF715
MKQPALLKEMIYVHPPKAPGKGWYDKFNRKLQSKGYTEVAYHTWIGHFEMTPEELRARRTPAERSLRQAFVLAGIIDTTIELELEGYEPYQLSTDEIVKTNAQIKHPFYIERFMADEETVIERNIRMEIVQNLLKEGFSHLLIAKVTKVRLAKILEIEQEIKQSKDNK